MDGVPIGSVITMLISIGIAAGGIIFSQIARTNALKAREDLVRLEGRVSGIEKACGEFESFKRTSAEDRGELHGIAAKIETTLAVLLTQMDGMAKQVDAMFKKIYNGGGK